MASALDHQQGTDMSRFAGAADNVVGIDRSERGPEGDENGDLAKLSLVGEFCRPLARELLGTVRAKASLRYLCAAGMVTVRRSRRCALFAIKPDVRTRLLLGRSLQWQDEVRKLAVSWHFRAGNIDSALGLIAKIESAAALELTEGNGGWMLAFHSGIEKLSYLIGRDIDPRRFPRTAIGQALATARLTGQLQAQQLESLRSVGDDIDGFAEEIAISSALARITLGSALSDESVSQMERAAQAPQTPAAMATMANVVLCRAYSTRGDFPLSLAAGLRALDFEAVHGLPSTLHSVHLSVGLASLRLGALRDAQYHFSQARSCAANHQGEDSIGVRSAEIFLALVSYEEGKNAREALRHSFDAILRQDGWLHLGTAGYMTAATLAYHSGSHEQAHRLLDDAEKLAIGLDMGQLRDVVRCRRDYFSILSEEPSTCSWVPNDATLDGIWRDDWQICKVFTYSCQLIHSDAWQEAVDLLDDGLASTDSDLNIPMKARLLALLVAGYWRTKAPERKLVEAINGLKKIVVEKGYAGSIVDCRFVLEGALLAIAASRTMPGVHADAQKILSALRAAAQRAACYDRVVALSERQKEVLNYLAEGLSNFQIAQRLQVAVGTISSYRRSLYRRLDVHSRAEIVRYVQAQSGDHQYRTEAEPLSLAPAAIAYSMAQTAGDSLIDHGLSPRQLEILQSVADGMTNKEIARRLDLSEQTVKTYRRTLYRKLGISSRYQAVTYLRAAVDGAVSTH